MKNNQENKGILITGTHIHKFVTICVFLALVFRLVSEWLGAGQIKLNETDFLFIGAFVANVGLLVLKDNQKNS